LACPDGGPHVGAEEATTMATKPGSNEPQQALNKSASVRLSPSVERLLARLKDAPVTAAYVMDAMLEMHADYASAVPRPVAIDSTRGEQRPASDWIGEAAVAFDFQASEVLHGRLLLVALALLDLDAGGQLLTSGVLPRILQEIANFPPLFPEWEYRWRILLGDRPYPPLSHDAAVADGEARPAGPDAASSADADAAPNLASNVAAKGAGEAPASDA